MKKVYGELYGEDAFEGISIPYQLKHVLEHIMNEESDMIIGVYDSYEEYKDAEVETSHYAKDGSNGTEEINTVADFKKWFFMEFNSRIVSGRVSTSTIELINNLEEIEIVDDVMSDEEAIELFEKAIDELSEAKKLHPMLLSDVLFYFTEFQNKWLNKVI